MNYKQKKGKNMGAAYGQLLVMLREAILGAIQGRFSLVDSSTAYGCWIIRCRDSVRTEALMDVARVAIESKGYKIADIQSTAWFVDGLVTEKNGEPFARFSITNNTRRGQAIIVCLDPDGQGR